MFFTSHKYNQKIKFIFANSSQIFKKKKGTVTENSEKKIAKNYSKFYTKFRIEFDKFMLNQNVNYTCLILFNHDSIYRNKKFLFPRLMNAIKNRNKRFINEILNHNIYGDFSHAHDLTLVSSHRTTSYAFASPLEHKFGVSTHFNDLRSSFFAL